MASSLSSTRGLIGFVSDVVDLANRDAEKIRSSMSAMRLGLTLGWRVLRIQDSKDREKEGEYLNRLISGVDLVDNTKLIIIGNQLEAMGFNIGERHLYQFLQGEYGEIAKKTAALVYEDETSIERLEALGSSREREKYTRAVAREQRSDLSRVDILMERQTKEGRVFLPSTGILSLLRDRAHFPASAERLI